MFESKMTSLMLIPKGILMIPTHEVVSNDNNAEIRDEDPQPNDHESGK